MAKHKFKTEVNQLLHLIIHSLYTHPEIFLRELISNASDALDRLKYLTLTDEEFKKLQFDPRIDIYLDTIKPAIIIPSEKEQKPRPVIKVSDNGIGMDSQELEKNLGTIARSGTREFLNSLTGDSKKDATLIGQFGVGFYSSFMVAERVEVISRKAGEQKAHRWISDGKGDFEITDASRNEQGTDVILFLNEKGKEFADRWAIEGIIKKYSNHIPFPIFLHYTEEESDKEKNEKIVGKTKVVQVNIASALWKKPKSELTEKDYHEFYKTIFHDPENPFLYIHTQAEGTLEYTTLFYIPSRAPIDLYWLDYKPGVKLYIKRVFITDDEKELIPHYLRFLRGIIDSEDLPLNISRETLQHNRILAKIKNDSVKRILSELQALKKDSPEKYETFYKEFRKPLKEGVYQDFSNRDTLVELLLFKSSEVDGYTDFSGYRSRMKHDQKAIYYITGENEKSLRSSPLLEAYRKKKIEVLLAEDEIDEIILPAIGKYEGFELKSVNRIDAAEDLKTAKDKEKEKGLEPLIKKIKKILDKEVKDVRASTRLNDSPSCIVADEHDPTIQMQNILKAIGQKNLPEVKPILEINPDHLLVKKLKEVEEGELFEDISRLLYEQALLLEGAELKDSNAFVKRLNRVLEKAL